MRIKIVVPTVGFVLLALGTVAWVGPGGHGSRRPVFAARSGGPPVHHLLATPQTVTVGYYDAAAKPILRIQSGDIVQMQTLVACTPALLEEAGLPPAQVQPELRAVIQQVTDKGPGIHILTGPIYVEGALPGDVLEVRIQDVQLAVPYAYNAFTPGHGAAQRFSLRPAAHRAAGFEAQGRAVRARHRSPATAFFWQHGRGAPRRVGPHQLLPALD